MENKHEKHIGIRIKEFRLSLPEKLSVPKFAAKYGLNKENLWKWEKGTDPADAKDYLKLENILSGKLENNPDSINKNANSVNPGWKSIENLTESGIRIAKSNETLANNNSRLITLLEQKYSTANVQTENTATDLGAIEILIELISEVGSGKKWTSKRAALEELGKRFGEKLLKKHGEGILSASHS